MPSIGVITLELRLDESHSLKDKRQVVKSLKDRLRGKFNVAVAEIDYQDLVAARADLGRNGLRRSQPRRADLAVSGAGGVGNVGRRPGRHDSGMD